jgi:hypothetical protein
MAGSAGSMMSIDSAVIAISAAVSATNSANEIFNCGGTPPPYGAAEGKPRCNAVIDLNSH